MALDIINLAPASKLMLAGFTKQIRDGADLRYVRKNELQDLNQDFDSRGGGLLTNGTGMIGGVALTNGGSTLKNFKPVSAGYDVRMRMVTDGRFLDGVGAGFSTEKNVYIGTSGSTENQIIPLNPSIVYRGGGSVVANAAAASANKRVYTGHMFLDLNGLGITSNHHQHMGLAKLAQDLNLGTDTYMYITRDGFLGSVDPHTEWRMTTTSYDTYALRRGPIFWDHCYADQKVNGLGESIPFTAMNDQGNPDKPAGFGYSRHYLYDLWVAGSTFELVGDHNGYTNVWRLPIRTDHGTHYGLSYAPTSTATMIPEGTWLSRNFHSGTYKYCYSGGSIPNDPDRIFRYNGYIGGIDYSGTNRSDNLPPGAAGARWMMLCNYQADAGMKQYHSALYMDSDPSVSTSVKSYGLIPEHYYITFKKTIDGVSSTAGKTFTSVQRYNP